MKNRLSCFAVTIALFTASLGAAMKDPGDRPPDNRIREVASITPVAICGSRFACSIIMATVSCECHRRESIGDVTANAKLLLAGSIYYFNGPFAVIEYRAVDPTVRDSATAIAHEYAYHINPAINAVAPFLKTLESKGFDSQRECESECRNAAKAVTGLFASTLKQTQDAEKKNKRGE
jgi:hypothetical protein